jgi:hypothetical protein
VNPYQTTRQEIVTDREPGTWPINHGMAYAGWLLSRELGQADPLSVTVDSAFPVVELGGEVHIYDPPRAAGYWQVVGVQQPFGPEPATWALEWRQDAP